MQLNKFLILYRTSSNQTSAVPAILLLNRHVRNGIQQFINTSKQKNKTDKTDLNQEVKNKQYIDQINHAKEIE